MDPKSIVSANSTTRPVPVPSRPANREPSFGKVRGPRK